MKKATKKTTTRKPTRKSKPKAATSAQAQPSAFVRGVVDGNIAVQRATGFVAGATNGLVIRPVRNALSWVIGSANTTMKTTTMACQGLVTSSRRKPAVKARGRKS